MKLSKRVTSLIVIVGMLFTACDDKKATERDLGTILFSAGENNGARNLVTMNTDGGNKTNLVNSSNPFSEGHYSPDGTKIVYGSWNNAGPCFMIMDADGDNQIKLTNLTGSAIYYQFPVFDFSPDGSKIVYSEGQIIYELELNGIKKKILTNTIGWRPIYSPTGEYIIFVGFYDNLHRMNSDGSNQIKLVNGIANRDYQRSFHFMPDGQQILVQKNNDLHFIDIDGSNLTNVTNGAYGSFIFCGLTPDGQKAMATFDNSKLYTLNLNNLDTTSLTNVPFHELGPPERFHFSPDGEQLVFWLDYDIYIIDIDGKNKKNLTNTPDIHEYHPVFMPTH